MPIRANRTHVLIPVAVFAAGMLVASVVGATTGTDVSAPSKLTVGPFGTTEIDPDPIDKDNCSIVRGSAPGIRVGDHVLVQPPHDMSGGLIAIASEQNHPDELTLQMCNIDDQNQTLDGDPKTWSYVVIR